KQLPPGLEPGFSETAAFMPPSVTFPNGCHVCEVEIDEATGVVRIVRHTVVDDVGRIVNPMLVKGQIHGGVVQGLGQGLFETLVYVEERRRGTSEATAFAEALELAEASEAWGLDGVWLGEIHFNPWRSVQSAPMNLAAFMAARTTRVRIGMAVIVLPLAHPLRIA